MKAPLVALVLMPFWVTVHKSEEILQNKRGVNISKEETLNKSKRLTVQDSFSSEVEEEVERKDKGRQFYQRSLKILKHSKNKEDTEKAHRLLVKAAKMGNQKAMEQLASDMLFGNNVPQNVEAAVSLYEILADEGSHKGQTALGFLSSYGIGVEYSQSKALVYYTFASNGGNLISQMILGYRYWLGINVPRSCEAALIYYKKVADYIASKLEENEDKPVEKVKLMERSENLGFDTEILDWDVHQYYKFLAERGDTQIQVYLGQLHLFGRKGLERDHAKAFYYFLKAANAGNAHGMAFLGKMYLEGSATVPQSNIAALKYFKMAAEKGNSIGLWGLGLIYLRGKGLPRNHSEAFKYFHKAAEKGYAQAQFQLGLMYHNGSGVKRDYKLAFHYFYLASQNGQPLAVYHLAEMYATGMGAFRSCQNAVKLYRTVCELGRWSDKFLTAHFAYQTGNVESSLVQYALLAEMGYEVAQCNSAHIMESENVKFLHREQIYSLALLLWKRAANQGNIFARVKTGDYHFYGFGIKRDYLTAAVHYNLAANQQSAQAMFNLAYMYEYGLGIPKDIHLARRWYDLAAETSPDAFIPVFLAYIRLEVMHLFTDLQLLKQMGNWKLSDLDHMLRLHWDLIVMIVIVLLLILLISSRQN
ncbi:protein sel-1 homolog 2 isoform X1 [Podarcis raffonei]|uniref:protein sel-1 homolog 2 isoform X1 n=2 Tax=Podarcis raffonei TaxID=65483 RepID=UPI002329030E|nr:protein sel-1 homolog 2 isoform X1 [Podarcis raffonei]